MFLQSLQGCLSDTVDTRNERLLKLLRNGSNKGLFGKKLLSSGRVVSKVVCLDDFYPHLVVFSSKFSFYNWFDTPFLKLLSE